MVKILEVKETLEDSELVENMYKIEELIKDIIKRLETDNELSIDDFRFTNIVLKKTKIALAKVNTVIRIGGDK